MCQWWLQASDQLIVISDDVAVEWQARPIRAKDHTYPFEIRDNDCAPIQIHAKCEMCEKHRQAKKLAELQQDNKQFESRFVIDGPRQTIEADEDEDWREQKKREEPPTNIERMK